MNNHDELTRLVVFPSDSGIRLDSFLAGATELSRRAARRLIGEGAVRLNQTVVRILSRTVEIGDLVEVLRLPSQLGVPGVPKLKPVSLLLEDGWICAVDKPAGTLSQPAATRRQGKELAMDELLTLHLALRQGQRPFLRVVHRLDRATSGVMLFGRRPEALPSLAASWREGRVRRMYLAVVEGRLELGSSLIEAPIARDRGHVWRFEVSAGGRPARTEVRVLSRGNEGTSIVACILESGRTHQVRVHLAQIGHPVAGDRLYGASRTIAPRALLHAFRLTLPHPCSKQPVRLQAPLPPDLEVFLPADRGTSFVNQLRDV
ncbi:MAG: RluA family pseudouridine synthase [Acidobacteria bacterium]|nr:RluA family pseudouridine synthase [Acidobacteriota bacterium]